MAKVPSGLLIILVSCGLLFNDIGKANAQVRKIPMGKPPSGVLFNMGGKHNKNFSTTSKYVSKETETIQNVKFVSEKIREIMDSIRRTLSMPDQEPSQPNVIIDSSGCKSDETRDGGKCEQSTKQNSEKQDVQGTHLITGGATVIGGTVATCAIENCNPGDNNLQNSPDRQFTTIPSGAKSNGTKLDFIHSLATRWLSSPLGREKSTKRSARGNRIRSNFY